MNKKGFSSLALVLAIVVVLVVGGILVYKKYQPQPISQPATTQQPSPATANGKIYKDAYYGFKVKYPSSLTVTLPSNGSVEIHGEVGFNVVLCAQTDRCYASAQKALNDGLKDHSIQINKTNAVEFVTDNSLHPYRTIYLERPDDHAIFNIDMEWDTSSPQGENILSTILSTFTLIPRGSSTSRPHIISPAYSLSGMTAWTQGKTYTIAWAGGDPNGSATISFNSQYSITVPNTGSYNLVISANLQPGQYTADINLGDIALESAPFLIVVPK